MASTALKFPAPTGLPFGVPNLAATVPKTSKTYKQVLNDGVSSEAVLLSMKGTRIRIPNLRAPMGHWPHAVHPQIDQLDDDVQKKLDSISSNMTDKGRLQKLKNSQVALFGASWWPYTTFEGLRIATDLSTWLFIWDDEVDSLEFSSLSEDLEESTAFRDETISYIKASLSSANLDDKEAALSRASNNATITSFKPVGEAISKVYTSCQIKTFLDELLLFVTSCEQEQKNHLTHRGVTSEEYMQRRMGSSAVRVCLAITEYAYGIELSRDIIQSEVMQRIWEETNIIISVSNDILSLKKEIAQGRADTLVPLLFLELGSVQAAVDRAADMIRSSVRRFDEAESEILASFSHDPEALESIRKFIEGCKFACTANLNWSLESGRYRLDRPLTEDGMEITL